MCLKRSLKHIHLPTYFCYSASLHGSGSPCPISVPAGSTSSCPFLPMLCLCPGRPHPGPPKTPSPDPGPHETSSPEPGPPAPHYCPPAPPSVSLRLVVYLQPAPRTASEMPLVPPLAPFYPPQSFCVLVPVLF